MRSAAFFDLDNTLVTGSSLWHFGRYLIDRGFIHRREVWRFARAEAQLALRRTEPAGGPHSIASRALSLARGRSVDDLTSLAQDFCQARLDRILVPTVAAELGALLDAGMPAYLVTASPVELAEAVAQALRMSGFVGTHAERRHGTYTGLLTGPICHGPAKFAAVRQLAADEGIDLATSWAFSDSLNDLPLLAAVRIPVAVNPNRRFAAVAEKNGWAILTAAGWERAPQVGPSITGWPSIA